MLAFLASSRMFSRQKCWRMPRKMAKQNLHNNDQQCPQNRSRQCPRMPPKCFKTITTKSDNDPTSFPGTSNAKGGCLALTRVFWRDLFPEMTFVSATLADIRLSRKPSVLGFSTTRKSRRATIVFLINTGREKLFWQLFSDYRYRFLIFRNYLLLQVQFSQATELINLQLQCRSFSVFSLRLSARQPAKPDKP